jgi:hypothetical protein
MDSEDLEKEKQERISPTRSSKSKIKNRQSSIVNSSRGAAWLFALIDSASLRPSEQGPRDTSRALPNQKSHINNHQS